MTLVVAEVIDGRITAVCDSLSSFKDNPEKTRRGTYSEARPKLVVLREDLMVGVAGDDYLKTVETLVGWRDLPTADFVERARELTETSPFGVRREVLVGALHPAQLWQLKKGNEVAAHEGYRRAWLGDHDAYKTFCGLERRADSISLHLQAPMQSLVNVYDHPTVGGIALRVDTCSHGFGYQATPVNLFEPPDTATMSYDGHCLRIKASFTAAPLSINVLTGQDPTRGALAIHFCGADFGYLYPHEAPWQQEKLTADSCEEFMMLAAGHGQALTAPSGCPAGSKP